MAQNTSKTYTQSPQSLVATPAVNGGGIGSDPVVAAAGPVALAQQAQAMVAKNQDSPPPASCQQRLWASFFFDGTGNNLDADLPTQEHSNVARLFRAMPLDNPAAGIYSRYVYGIGTYFREIGDDGKGWGVDTHNGFGAMGQERLDWAFKELAIIIDKAEKLAQNPTNKILQINIAVFGFSRGATLARAFVRDLLKNKCTVQGAQVRWKKGNYPLAIRFIGVWDTVASVGLPMSANNATAMRKNRSLPLLESARQTPQPGGVRAVDLAFGPPGADPAPGTADGHASWANDLAIPGQLIGQCVHMIAGHEIRNSFPVDSVGRENIKPENCKEMVYPGMHSDVGGGYRPGEGGRGIAAPANSRLRSDLGLSLIPLRAMYDEASKAGVPLRAMGSADWTADNQRDFDTSPALKDLFNHYMQQVGWGGRRLGDEMLAHMRMYFAWRFQHIQRKQQGDKQEAETIGKNEKVWQADQQALDAEIAKLDVQRTQARRDRLAAQEKKNNAMSAQWQNPNVDVAALKATLAQADQQIASADKRYQDLDDKIKSLQARKDTLPSQGTLAPNLNANDDQLIADARSVLAAIKRQPNLSQQLRPHYKNLIETYEAEFVRGQGLRDAKIIAFFDNHVHDSLGDFSRDSTLPSDPRVVYSGGDTKLKYAFNDAKDQQIGSTQSAVAA